MVAGLVAAAINGADPGACVRRAWAGLTAKDGAWGHVVAIGKASAAMARAACALGAGRQGGVVLAPADSAIQDGIPAAVRVRAADHPLPTARNVSAAREVEAHAAGLREADTLLVLISGGGSAHLTLPAEGLTLDDLRAATAAMLDAGTTIDELNMVRRHCERLKGGGLARLAYPARTAVMVLSDVMGDRLEVIASGPCAPDPSTFADALGVVDRYGLRGRVPAVVAHLARGASGAVPETPKAGDPVFARVSHTIIGNNALARAAVRVHLERQGWRVEEEVRALTGEAAGAGEMLGARAAVMRAGAGGAGAGIAGAALVLGGETTVRTAGATGRGGRCQEMALSAACAIEGMRGVTIACVATDGVDGPTDAAGAVVTGETVRRGRSMGLEAREHLSRHDSGTFLERVGGLIRTGATGTNVNDVAVVLVMPDGGAGGGAGATA